MFVFEVASERNSPPQPKLTGQMSETKGKTKDGKYSVRKLLRNIFVSAFTNWFHPNWLISIVNELEQNFSDVFFAHCFEWTHVVGNFIIHGCVSIKHQVGRGRDENILAFIEKPLCVEYFRRVNLWNSQLGRLKTAAQKSFLTFAMYLHLLRLFHAQLPV